MAQGNTQAVIPRSTKVRLTEEAWAKAVEIVRRKNQRDPLYQANLQRVVNQAVHLYYAQVEEEEADNAAN